MITRREFVKSGAAFAAASAALPAMAGRDKMIWGALLHVGITMWNDSVLKQRDSASGAGLQLAPPPLQPNFNRGIWDRLTNRMAKVGMNMVVIDIGESLRFESHPE